MAGMRTMVPCTIIRPAPATRVDRRNILRQRMGAASLKCSAPRRAALEMARLTPDITRLNRLPIPKQPETMRTILTNRLPVPKQPETMRITRTNPPPVRNQLEVMRIIPANRPPVPKQVATMRITRMPPPPPRNQREVTRDTKEARCPVSTALTR